MMYRNIYPFYHIAVGTEDATGTSKEVDQIKGSSLMEWMLKVA